MSREWKPGDVAMVACSDGHERLATFKPASHTEGMWVFPSGEYRWVSESDARFVVVISPEDREQVERLRDAITVQMYCDDYVTTGDVEQALREFANPTPLKLEEPTGLGAVVEDADGGRWVRIKGGEFNKPWYDAAGLGMHAHWQTVEAVKVLSEGVRDE